LAASGLESHQKDVAATSIAVAIQWAFCTARHPNIMACGIHLKSVSRVIAGTTTLLRPLAHALGVEFHEEDVPAARIGVAF